MQLLTIAFEDGAGVEARIVAEVDALQGRGVLRLLDFLLRCEEPRPAAALGHRPSSGDRVRANADKCTAHAKSRGGSDSSADRSA